MPASCQCSQELASTEHDDHGDDDNDADADDDEEDDDDYYYDVDDVDDVDDDEYADPDADICYHMLMIPTVIMVNMTILSNYLDMSE